ncbi:uncharacterized protein LOC119659354 [Hermetia illucens]|uniref:uncharacterized protein LOC119659354 n=1 Tax=Hermetia illucens TaxID=343691 RepID=UPI0018CC6359|nr:uncharacterized protein LOC119659354 [Hermetia illucens]XP_037923332.1 uncharacterized protein LOC119659354 [Hermetia illucens]XP_037923333.1 uncharacterized protein LOC119659354 [Hermetia illucens]XP_037923334.1 uncharacterized protein LOC119659354 [Hermetia illucens]
MKALVLTFFVVSLVSGNSPRDCNLRYNYKAPGIFVKQSNGDLSIITSGNGKIPLSNGDSIEAFCSTNFTDLGDQTFDGKLKNLTFTCANGTISYIPAPNYAPVKLNDSQMSCQQEALFYAQPVPYCQFMGLQYGFQISSTPISLAELCYNNQQLQTTFVHFVLGDRSQILGEQTKLNPSNISTILSQQAFSFSSQAVNSQEESLRNSIATFAPLLSADIKYEFEGLAPLNLLSDMFIQYTQDFKYAYLVPWWSSLKNGNWKAIMAAIENIQANGVYDIYMGTSGNISYPNNNNDEVVQILSYSDGKIIKVVPKYIWVYIKERNTQDKGVTIIAVNSPFFDENAKDAFLCNDVCHNVDWLSSLLLTSHMPAFGYVYCCHPDDVGKLLNGFPQTNN